MKPLAEETWNGAAEKRLRQRCECPSCRGIEVHPPSYYEARLAALREVREMVELRASDNRALAGTKEKRK